VLCTVTGSDIRRLKECGNNCWLIASRQLLPRFLGWMRLPTASVPVSPRMISESVCLLLILLPRSVSKTFTIRCLSVLALTTKFDGFLPSHKRLALYWYYSINILKVRGNYRRPLPPCFVQTVRDLYPEPAGTTYTGYVLANPKHELEQVPGTISNKKFKAGHFDSSSSSDSDSD
jgi:hypothetical protein